MMTVLVLVIVFAVAAMLYNSAAVELPDELAFLRPVAPAVAPAGAKVVDYKGWRVTQVGSTVELVKAFSGAVEVGTVKHPAPSIGILCFEGKLDIRVDSKLKTTGTQVTEVSLGQAAPQNWNKGPDTNIFPPEAGPFLGALLRTPQDFTLRLSYRSMGVQPSVLAVTGLAELVSQLPQGCRP